MKDKEYYMLRNGVVGCSKENIAQVRELIASVKRIHARDPYVKELLAFMDGSSESIRGDVVVIEAVMPADYGMSFMAPREEIGNPELRKKLDEGKACLGGTKSLHNTDVNGDRKNVKDIVVFGNGDMFQLLCKASSENEGWMKSTKAMEIPGAGCVVQVTTQQRNPDGSYSLDDAVTFVPHVQIKETRNPDGEVVGREMVKAPSTCFPNIPGSGHYPHSY